MPTTSLTNIKLNFSIGDGSSSATKFGVVYSVDGGTTWTVLGDYTYNFFYYENLNDCGYGFGAYFFKRFVVLKTLTPADGCFGMGVAFDGVYMKIKQ